MLVGNSTLTTTLKTKSYSIYNKDRLILPLISLQGDGSIRVTRDSAL